MRISLAASMPKSTPLAPWWGQAKKTSPKVAFWMELYARFSIALRRACDRLAAERNIYRLKLTDLLNNKTS
jgi:hypothetical protein